MSNEYDFGFSFTDVEEPLAAPTQEQTPVATSDDLKALESKIDGLLNQQAQYVEEYYKNKLREVEGLILPLLYNLMKNPEKAYIKWENRIPIIQAQIDKIIAVTRS